MAKRSKKTGGVVDTARYDYDKIRIRDKSGKIRHSANNGDSIAKALLLHIVNGGTIEQVIKANKLETKTKGKNAGLVRMSVGVALRGIVRKGENVKIGPLVVKSLKQPIAMPKVEAKAPARGSAKKTAKPKTKAKPVRKRAPRAKPAADTAPAPEASAEAAV